MSVDAWPNPIHDHRPNELLWSRANMTEAIPGVATALTWTFWEQGFETANREIWSRLGLLSKAEAGVAQGVRAQDDFVSIFFGRPVVNVDRLRSLFARMPGGDPDQVELQLLGSVRPGVVSPRTRRRWPFIVVRAPFQLTGLDRKASAVRSQTDAWWRRAVSTHHPDAASAARGLREAMDRFNHIQRTHGLCLMVGQLAFERLSMLCARTGTSDLLLDLSASGRGVEESAMLDDLWHVADGRRTLESFIADHGFHGPEEGALHSRSWREDSGPVRALVQRYRDQGQRKPSTSGPRRAAAEAQLMAIGSALKRARTRRILAAADRAVPRREITKAAFLQTIDAARHAARALGRHLHEAGLIDDPEHVFHLTMNEATAIPFEIDPTVARERAAIRDQYLSVDVATTFVGPPTVDELLPRARSTGEVVTLHGVAASAGTATGTARVIASADDIGDLEPGEILVCTMTDPSWVPFFEIAAAAVVEIGGPLSHAAIVAREMGLPCVVGVDGATWRISSGDMVVVDGAAGTVIVTPNSKESL